MNRLLSLERELYGRRRRSRAAQLPFSILKLKSDAEARSFQPKGADVSNKLLLTVDVGTPPPGRVTFAWSVSPAGALDLATPNMPRTMVEGRRPGVAQATLELYVAGKVADSLVVPVCVPQYVWVSDDSFKLEDFLRRLDLAPLHDRVLKDAIATAQKILSFANFRVVGTNQRPQNAMGLFVSLYLDDEDRSDPKRLSGRISPGLGARMFLAGSLSTGSSVAKMLKRVADRNRSLRGADDLGAAAVARFLGGLIVCETLKNVAMPDSPFEPFTTATLGIPDWPDGKPLPPVSSYGAPRIVSADQRTDLITFNPIAPDFK